MLLCVFLPLVNLAKHAVLQKTELNMELVLYYILKDIRLFKISRT